MNNNARASWKPSRKWCVTQVTAAAAFLVAWVNAGEWNKTLLVALIGLLAQAVIGFLTPNSTGAATPAVPVAGPTAPLTPAV